MQCTCVVVIVALVSLSCFTAAAAAPSLHVTPDTITPQGSWIRVTWANLPDREGNWLALFSPPSVDYRPVAPVSYPESPYPSVATAPIAWFDLSAAGMSRHGSTDVFLRNLRADYVVRVYTNGTERPEVVEGVAAQVAQDKPSTHNRPRLTIGRTQGEYTLNWASGKCSGTPQVRYGVVEGGPYSNMVEAQSSTFTKEQMVAFPANSSGWRDPGVQHWAVMTGLKPGTEYFYVFGDEDCGFSEEMQFATSKADAEVTKFITYGDMGVSPTNNWAPHWPSVDARTVISLVQRHELQNDMAFVLHVGDLSYATGVLAGWDGFLSEIVPLSSRVRYQTCLGNHERDVPGTSVFFNGSDSGGEGGVPTHAYFKNGNASFDEPWYSFEDGLVHMTVISTEHDVAPGSPQHSWVMRDLASVDRSRTPWLVFAGHRPMYSSRVKHDKHFADAFEDLFLKYQVDLVIMAHYHVYERTCPVYNATCLPDPQPGAYTAPVHVVVGTAGKKLDHFPPPSEIQPWSLVRDSTFGYSRVTMNRTALVFEFVEAETQWVRDAFHLLK